MERGDGRKPALGKGGQFLERALSAELRAWKPEAEKDENGQPKKPPLPPTSDRFNELEAMIATGHSILEWNAMTETQRAELIAHWTEKNLRDGFMAEYRRKEYEGRLSGSKPASRGGPSPDQKTMASLNERLKKMRESQIAERIKSKTG